MANLSVVSVSKYPIKLSLAEGTHASSPIAPDV